MRRVAWLGGARSRTRTGTALRPRDFKSLASTDFATRARGSEGECGAILLKVAPGGVHVETFAHGAKSLNLRDSRASYSVNLCERTFQP